MKGIKLLVTGYSTFGDFQENPSQLVVEKLRDELRVANVAQQIIKDSNLPEDIQLQIDTEIIEVDYQKALCASKNAFLKIDEVDV